MNKEKYFKKVILFLLLNLAILSWSADTESDVRIKELELKTEKLSGRDKVDALNELSKLYRLTNPTKGLLYGNLAGDLSRDLQYQKGEAFAFNNNGVNYSILGDYSKAVDCYRKSLHIYEMIKDLAGISGSLSNIGNIYNLLEKNDQALEYYQRALKIDESLNNKKGTRYVLNNMGDIYRKRFQYDQALNTFRRALAISRESNDLFGIASAYNNMANIFGDMGNYDQALDFYQQSLKVKEKTGDQSSIANSLNNIGNLYMKLDNYSQSLSYHQESLKIFETIGDMNSISRVLNDMGACYAKTGKKTQALAVYNKSLKIRETAGDKLGMASIISNIGSIYFDLKQYPAALPYFQKSVLLCNDTEDKLTKAKSLCLIGLIYIRLGHYTLAEENFKGSLVIAQESKKLYLLLDVYHGFSELYETTGKFRDALVYHKQFFQTYEKIFSEKSQKQIQELQAKYDTEKKEKKITLMQKNEEVQALQLSRSQLQRNSLIIGLLLVLTILILLFYRYLYLFAFWKKKNYISHYRLNEKIGSGGMGIVYKAHDIKDKSIELAVKVLREEYSTDDLYKKRFKNEALIVDQLDHPNIIKVVERGESSGNLFIAMELLTGRPLSDVILQESLPLSAKLHIMNQVCSALIKIHSRNIIHRDIKPENVMIIEQNNDPYFVKLLDFGLAKHQSFTRLTQTGALIGSLYYMAPEQFAGQEGNSASDIYSLGVVFYLLLSGKKPFDAKDSLEIDEIIMQFEPTPLTQLDGSLPKQLSALVMAMLSKKPANRPILEEVQSILSQTILH